MEHRQYAGFWLRLAAQFIDILVMLIIFIMPLGFIYGTDYWLGEQLIYGFWHVILGYVVPVLATIWFWLRYMATPGKMLTKIKVVDAETGNKITIGQAVLRYFAYIPAILPLGLGFLWVGIDKRKQGWHDKLAGTAVVRHTDK
ncbi:MAG: RDD family protein [Gammaproteobacteria bacterium]|jgi:uncharacterized RDD family membrane protein YckC|nr:RDD family protein [Gammaproteobacteria bacterium]